MLKLNTRSPAEAVIRSLRKQFQGNSIGMTDKASANGCLRLIERDRSKIEASLTCVTDLGSSLTPGAPEYMGDQQYGDLVERFNQEREQGRRDVLPPGVPSCCVIDRSSAALHVFCIQDDGHQVASHIFHYNLVEKRNFWSWTCYTTMPKDSMGGTHYGLGDSDGAEGVSHAMGGHLAAALALMQPPSPVEPAPASAAQAATDGVAFSEQLVALHRRNAPEEEFLQAMLSEIQTNPAFALKDDLPADTTQLDVAKDMLPLLLEGCGIPYPKPAPKPRPKIERPKRQRTAPMNAEHRALLERVKLARAVAGNTRNKEPAPIVYILTHPKFPDHLKIGSCQNVDARLSKYQTGCPHRAYEMRHMEYCADGRVVEEYIKLQQAEAREGATEWYRLSVEQAWEIVKQAIIACAE